MDSSRLRRANMKSRYTSTMMDARLAMWRGNNEGI